MIWSVAFWKGAGERAFKTFFQTAGAMLVALVGKEAIPSIGLEGVKWVHVLSVAAMAAVLSLCTSIGNAQFTAGVQPAVAVPEDEARRGISSSS